MFCGFLQFYIMGPNILLEMSKLCFQLQWAFAKFQLKFCHLFAHYWIHMQPAIKTKTLIFVGFIHSESDVRYFGEDVPGVSQVENIINHILWGNYLISYFFQSFSEDQTFSYQDEEGTITVLGSPIKFDPPNLNFKEKWVVLFCRLY